MMNSQRLTEPPVLVHQCSKPESGKLLMHAHPNTGESWLGFLLRLSVGNHFPSMSSIVGICGYARMNELLSQNPREVLHRLGISVSDTSEWASHDVPRTFSPNRSRLGRISQHWKTRLCPNCLRTDAEHPYLRSHWDWSMQIHCPTHKVLLLERCCDCDEPIDVRRKQLVYCDCGADYRQQQTPNADAFVNAFSRLLPEIDINRLGKTFERQPLIYQEAVRVCEWIALPISTDGQRPKRKSLRQVLLTPEDIERLCLLTENWPEELANSFMPKLVQSDLSFRSVLAKNLFRNSFGLFEVVLKEFYAKLNSSPISEIEKSRNTYSISHHGYIKSLVQMTGHSWATLRKHIDLGNIAPIEHNCGDLFDPYRIDLDAHWFKLIEKFYTETLDISSSAIKAGCSELAMRGLVRANCIPSESINRETRSLTFRRIQPKSIDQFQNELFSIACYDMKQIEAGIHFSDWETRRFDSRVNQHLIWRDILAAIRINKLKLYKAVATPTELDQLFICDKDLIVIRDKRRSNRACFF